jgi:hypothetical protein
MFRRKTEASLGGRVRHAVLYFIVNPFSGFAWTSTNLLFAAAVSLFAVLIMALMQRGDIPSYLVSGLITLSIGIYSLRRLYLIVENETAVRIMSAMKNKLISLSV